MTPAQAREIGYAASKAIIKVGGACNEKCVFCHARGFREAELTLEHVAQKIDLAKQRGFEMVVFSGGEPTIHPSLREMIDHVLRHRMLLGFVTNGVRLGYADFCHALLQRNLRYVYLSLHGGDAQTHNRAVVAKTFDQTMAAVHNLAGRGVALTVNCVVTTMNIDHLDALATQLTGIPEVRIKYSFVQLRGAGLENANWLVPRLSDAAKAIRAVIERHPALELTWGGLPMCLMPGLEDRTDDLLTNHITVMSEVDETHFFPVDTRDFVKPAICSPCVLSARCEGLHTEYAARLGDAELTPHVGARPNSFDFERQEIFAGTPGPKCPALERGEPPWGRQRSLYFAHRGRLELYATRTRDFSDEEITLTRKRGQIYLDASDKPAPDDFSADLRLLAPHSACQGCPLSSTCPGAVLTLDEDVFLRDDAAVRDHLKTLSGRVLDIGCGDAPYRQNIPPTVRYVGLDPAGGSGTHAIPIEQGLPEPGPFDHVLFLRSFNHVADPQRALTLVGEALRPGGTLFVCDNVPFGLVRSPTQLARARGSHGLTFDHLRNHGLGDALTALAGQPFSVTRARDVEPGRSNQWWFLAVRT